MIILYYLIPPSRLGLQVSKIMIQVFLSDNLQV